MTTRVKWTLIALAAIWLAVIVTSFFAPDLVSGSQQEHLRVALFVNWLWGLLATMSLLRALRFRSGKDGAWFAVGLGITVIWVVVAGVSLWGPSLETGSDPTTLPLSAIIAPILGLLLTRFLIEFVFDLKDSIAGPSGTTDEE